MEFRKTNSNDMELIVALERRMREEEPGVYPPFDQEKFIKNFITYKIEDYPSNEVIVCLDDTDIIGRIDLIVEQSLMDFGRVGYIDWVYVLKSKRKQGIAKKLLLEAEKIFQEQSCEFFYLFVAENEEAQAFYASVDVEIKPIKRASKKLMK